MSGVKSHTLKKKKLSLILFKLSWLFKLSVGIKINDLEGNKTFKIWNLYQKGAFLQKIEKCGVKSEIFERPIDWLMGTGHV